eukprot:tig00021537_g22294.t1
MAVEGALRALQCRVQRAIACGVCWRGKRVVALEFTILHEGGESRRLCKKKHEFSPVQLVFDPRDGWKEHIAEPRVTQRGWVDNAKTKICKANLQGSCTAGGACRYAHGFAELEKHLEKFLETKERVKRAKSLAAELSGGIALDAAHGGPQASSAAGAAASRRVRPGRDKRRQRAASAEAGTPDRGTPAPPPPTPVPEEEAAEALAERVASAGLATPPPRSPPPRVAETGRRTFAAALAGRPAPPAPQRPPSPRAMLVLRRRGSALSEGSAPALARPGTPPSGSSGAASAASSPRRRFP